MKWQKLNLYFVFIVKKALAFLILCTIIFPTLETILEAVINKNPNNFSNIYFNSFINFWTNNYNQILSSELNGYDLNAKELFFKFFLQSFWLISTTLITTLFFSSIIGIKLAIYQNSKKTKIINSFAKLLNFLPIFLLIPIVIIVFTQLGQNTSFIPIEEINFKISFLSFLPLWISLNIPIILLLISIIKNIAFKYMKSNFYIMALTLGKKRHYLIYKVLLKNIIIDFLPYIISIYTLILSFSFIAERSFSFNGQSFILNFAFNRGETSLIVYGLFFNITIIYWFQVFLLIIASLLNPLVEINQKNKYGIIQKFRNNKIKKFNVEKGQNLEIKKY